jgi:hypothetical protein
MGAPASKQLLSEDSNYSNQKGRPIKKTYGTGSVTPMSVYTTHDSLDRHLVKLAKWKNQLHSPPLVYNQEFYEPIL